MSKFQTDGLGVALSVVGDAKIVTLSLAGTKTRQIATTVYDAAVSVKTQAATVRYISRNPTVATVSAGGLITGVTKGQATIEVSYPVFENGHGLANDGTHAEKIYHEITVVVNA